MTKVINEQRRLIDTMISSQEYVDIGQRQHQGYHDILDESGSEVSAAHKESHTHEISDSDDKYENNILFPHGDADKKSPPIPDRYKQFVDKWFGMECDTENVKIIKEKYLEPENTILLSGKELNEEIQKTTALS